MSIRKSGWIFICNIYTVLRKGLMAGLVLLVRGYQLFISPYFPTSCRYHPTCSCYAIDAVRMHGPLKGTLLAAWRVLRCNPWSSGGEDPVPERKTDSTGLPGHRGDADHYVNARIHGYSGHAGHFENARLHGQTGYAGHHCPENTIHSNMNRHHF